jgi:hypothetical protein
VCLCVCVLYVCVKSMRVHTCGESGFMHIHTILMHIDRMLMHIHTIGDLVSERYGLKGLGQWPPSGLAHSR